MRKCTSILIFLFLGFYQSFGQNTDGLERFEIENPSTLSSENSQNMDTLIRLVGNAVITDSEISNKKVANARLAKMEASERAKEEAKIARLEARKRSTEVPGDCVGYKGVTEYTVRSGDTLGKIGATLYGNSAYSTLIAVYNKKPADKLYIGDTLATLSPYDILMTVGRPVYRRYPYAMRDILVVHEQFKELEQTIRDEKKAGSYSAETKKSLDELIWLMDQIKKDFFGKVDGISEPPNSTTMQLHSAHNNLKAIRRGDLGRKNIRIQRVHLYLINGFSYAVAWGRDGFKS